MLSLLITLCALPYYAGLRVARALIPAILWVTRAHLDTDGGWEVTSKFFEPDLAGIKSAIRWNWFPIPQCATCGRHQTEAEHATEQCGEWCDNYVPKAPTLAQRLWPRVEY